MQNKLLEHGFYAGMSKKKVKEMQHDLANLSAYIDIDERTQGSTGKLYDLFDGSNNHSCGILDTVKTKSTVALNVGETILTDKVVSTVGFKVGQEITVQDNVNIERPIVTRVGETVSTNINRQDVSVVNSAYDTSGNGGRKLVKLSNDWLVTCSFNAGSGTIYLYVSKDNGATWSQLCYTNTTYTSANFAIMASSTNIYLLFNIQSQTSAPGLAFYKIDALTVTNTALTGGITLDTQTSYGIGVSLITNLEGTEIHACWSSKNATYPSSFNIRYAKGTIASDGSVTWGSVQQITSMNTTGQDTLNPTIVLNANNYPVIIYSDYVGSYRIFKQMYNGTSWSPTMIYNGSTYQQSSPSAIFVPSSINGLANGRIWVAWHGKDGTYAQPNMYVSYSDDGGVTWSAKVDVTKNNNGAFNGSITVNKNNKISIVCEWHDGANRHLYKVENTNGTWSTPTSIKNTTSPSNLYPSTLIDLMLDITEPLFIYKTSTNIGFYGTWVDNIYTPHLEITPLTNSYTKNALVYRSLGKIVNNKLGFSDGVDNSVTYTRTDVSVVNSAYDTSGNGGRKLVRLDNGWLVAGVYDIAGVDLYLYVSKDNGSSFAQLCYFLNLHSSTTWSLVSKGTQLYILVTTGGTTVRMYNVDASLIGNININTDATYRIDLDSSQTATGGCSLAINPQGTELHATWSSKNATYPNSFNIRYAKGTIASDGSVTWGSVTQITTRNTSGLDAKNPTIVVNTTGYPIIIYEITDTFPAYGLCCKYYNGSSWAYGNGDAVSGKVIYNIQGSYIQSNPSAIFVPQSVNGLVNGRIWVTWHGSDSSQSVFNLRLSYSDDGGTTWSAMTKFTSGNSYSQYSPSIAVNKNNEVYIIWHGATDSAYSDIKYVKYYNNVFENIVIASEGVTASKSYPSVLCDINFDLPVFIYQDTQGAKVGFYGTWTNNFKVPLFQEDVRYIITPSTNTETQAVMWVNHEQDNGLTIDVDYSMVDDNSNESYHDMTNTNNVDVSGITEKEFVYSSAYGHKMSSRLTMTRNATSLNKSIIKILGAIGE